MSGGSAEEVRAHIKTYLMVFLSLAVLTVVTVYIAYLHLPTHTAILIAMIVATTKGSLVALHFMHLNSEKQIIYRTLGLTAVFFVFLMSIILYL